MQTEAREGKLLAEIEEVKREATRTPATRALADSRSLIEVLRASEGSEGEAARRRLAAVLRDLVRRIDLFAVRAGHWQFVLAEVGLGEGLRRACWCSNRREGRFYGQNAPVGSAAAGGRDVRDWIESAAAAKPRSVNDAEGHFKLMVSHLIQPAAISEGSPHYSGGDGNVIVRPIL